MIETIITFLAAAFFFTIFVYMFVLGIRTFRYRLIEKEIVRKISKWTNNVEDFYKIIYPKKVAEQKIVEYNLEIHEIRGVKALLLGIMLIFLGLIGITISIKLVLTIFIR